MYCRILRQKKENQTRGGKGQRAGWEGERERRGEKLERGREKTEIDES